MLPTRSPKRRYFKHNWIHVRSCYTATNNPQTITDMSAFCIRVSPFISESNARDSKTNIQHTSKCPELQTPKNISQFPGLPTSQSFPPSDLSVDHPRWQAELVASRPSAPRSQSPRADPFHGAPWAGNGIHAERQEWWLKAMKMNKESFGTQICLLWASVALTWGNVLYWIYQSITASEHESDFTFDMWLQAGRKHSQIWSPDFFRCVVIDWCFSAKSPAWENHPAILRHLQFCNRHHNVHIHTCAIPSLNSSYDLSCELVSNSQCHIYMWKHMCFDRWSSWFLASAWALRCLDWAAKCL